MERAFTSQQCVLMISAQRGFSSGKPVFSAPQKLSKFLFDLVPGRLGGPHTGRQQHQMLYLHDHKGIGHSVSRQCVSPGGEGGEERVLRYSGFQVIGMIEWGKKNQNPKKSIGLPTKLQKIPGPKVNPQRIPCRILEP